LWTEKTAGTSSVIIIIGVGITAKYYKLKRCVDRVRSREHNKDEVREKKKRKEKKRKEKKKQRAVPCQKRWHSHPPG